MESGLKYCITVDVHPGIWFVLGFFESLGPFPQLSQRNQLLREPMKFQAYRAESSKQERGV